MATIEGIRIRNFRSLKDITLGSLIGSNGDALSPMTVVIGKNGVGKSSLLDALGFLADALKDGVETACDARGRGGFKRIRTQGESGPIQFDLYYRQASNDRPIAYELSIDIDKDHRPFVAGERLRQRRKGQRYGQPFSFLRLVKGEGVAWRGDSVADREDEFNMDKDFASFVKSTKENTEETTAKEFVKLPDVRELGIVSIRSLQQHPRIEAFREFIKSWHLSYFSPNASRSLPMAGAQAHLNSSGDNLSNVVQFMERRHKDSFKNILARIAQKIPGIQSIDTKSTDDGRLLLRFNDSGFQDPFYAQHMSDGTLKVFAYLLMLEDPSPPPFLCIEEPENGLYHNLLEALALEFRTHATGRKRGTQMFITTHQPYFVDGLKPEELWILEKNNQGHASIRRSSADPLVQNMVSEGLPLGGLWSSNYLDGE